MGQKSTLPWISQYGMWPLLSLFGEPFASGFAAAKPKMFRQVFPGMSPEQFGGFGLGGLFPQSRYLGEYQPFEFLATNPYGRPGGPSQEEIDLLNQSYFGRVAPIDLSTARNVFEQQQQFQQSLLPGGGYFPASTAEMFQALGGQIPIPQVPTLPALTLPQAPSLPPFSFDVGGTAQNTLQALISGQPGLADALSRSLNPQIPLPSQSIFDMVAAQNPQLDRYVQQATEGTRQAFEAEIARQQANLASQFAAQGAYMSGPMLNALALAGAQGAADFARTIGQLQLQAAEMEQGRIYEAASTMYGTEYARNLAQVQIAAETARSLANTFAEVAAKTASAEASAAAAAYNAQADFLASVFNTQANAAVHAYNAQADFLARTFGTQMQAAIDQQNIVANMAIRAADLLQRGYATSFDEAMAMAEAEQRNKQAALDALYQDYFGPGTRALEMLGILARVPTVSKTTGGGFNIGSLLTGSTGEALGDALKSLILLRL